MSVFDNVRQLDLRTVAEHYGLNAHGGMVNCIFHDDRTPSMKLYPDHFYCFGCGEHGDVTALTARLFDLRPYEAAKKLCADFGISADESKPSITQRIRIGGEPPLAIAPQDCVSTMDTGRFRKQSLLPYKSYQEQENKAFRILSDYCKLLMKQREQYAPKSPDEELHPLFVESLTKLSEYEYYAEIFISGSRDERKAFISERKELIDELERKLHREHKITRTDNISIA